MTNIISLNEAKQKRMASDNPEHKKADTKASGAKCPQCGAHAIKPHSPFCSRRCAQLDLGRWLNEDYRIPAEEAMDDHDIDALITQLEKDET